MNADIIFVISDGQVIEQGSHEELIARNGKYAELWSKQIFLKPKETKEDVQDISESAPKSTLECEQTDSATDSDTSTRSKTVSKGNEQVAATPNGHKREVDQ